MNLFRPTNITMLFHVSMFIIFSYVSSSYSSTSDTIIAWGNNSFSICTTPALSQNVKSISAGAFHALALKADGTVTIWGQESYIPSNLNNVVAIAAGSRYSLALKADGSVICWGTYFYITPPVANIISNLNGIRAISCYDNHCLALRQDGVVIEWEMYGSPNVKFSAFSADNELVQWEEWYPTPIFSSNPPVPIIDNIKAISAAPYFSVVLKKDSTIALWGQPLPQDIPQPVNLKGVVSISAGRHHVVALKSDSTVVSWGVRNAASIPFHIGLKKIIAIDAGEMQTIVLRSDSTVVGWGNSAIIPPGLRSVRAVCASKNSNLYPFMLALQTKSKYPCLDQFYENSMFFNLSNSYRFHWYLGAKVFMQNAQTFIAGMGGCLKNVSVALIYNYHQSFINYTGLLPGDLVVEIQKTTLDTVSTGLLGENNRWLSRVPDGKAIASVTIPNSHIQYSSDDRKPVWLNVEFPHPALLNKNETYSIVLRTTATDFSFYGDIGYYLPHSTMYMGGYQHGQALYKIFNSVPALPENYYHPFLNDARFWKVNQNVNNSVDFFFATYMEPPKTDYIIEMMINQLNSVNAPGVNGLISTLNQVESKLDEALQDLRDGTITRDMFIQRCQVVVNNLHAFSNQLQGFIDNGKIPSPISTDLIQETSMLLELINNLIEGT